MPNAFVTAVALACLGSALAVIAWSRLRLSASRRRARQVLEALANDEIGDPTCETAREVQ